MRFRASCGPTLARMDWPYAVHTPALPPLSSNATQPDVARQKMTHSSSEGTSSASRAGPVRAPAYSPQVAPTGGSERRGQPVGVAVADVLVEPSRVGVELSVVIMELSVTVVVLSVAIVELSVALVMLSLAELTVVAVVVVVLPPVPGKHCPQAASNTPRSVPGVWLAARRALSSNRAHLTVPPPKPPIANPKTWHWSDCAHAATQSLVV